MTPEDLLRWSKRKRPRTAFTDLRLMDESELEPVEQKKYAEPVWTPCDKAWSEEC